MRRALFTVVGMLAGAIVGWIVIFAVITHVFPLLGWTDEMSRGIAGWHLLVFVGPMFVLVGGVLAFILASHRSR